MWWLMMIGMIVLWIGVIALVVWLVRTWTSGRAVTGTAAGAVVLPSAVTSPLAAPVVDGTADTTVVAARLADPAPLAEAAETPRQILDRRYAAGEIDRKDYLQRKTDLE